jgi:S1-C subfamily serine protease
MGSETAVLRNTVGVALLAGLMLRSSGTGTYRTAYNRASSHVVSVASTSLHRDMFSRAMKEHVIGTGTGFVFNSDGHIVTNYHVIKDAVNVRVNGKHAVVIGVDPRRDVAVLKEGEDTEIRGHLRFCVSAPAVGQEVLAIGDPFDLKESLTVGIVSGTDRTVTNGEGTNTLLHMIQTDAPINPGNSGGPLIDRNYGCVLGMNTALVAPGIGLAIPASDVEDSINAILGNSSSEQQRFLGLEFMPDGMTERLDLPGLAIVGTLDEDSEFIPTSRDAFGRPVLGDILLEADGRPLKKLEDLQSVLAAPRNNDDTIVLKVLRRNEIIEIIK